MASRAGQRSQISPRVLAAKENGKRGGLATAQKHGPEFIQARGGKGGQACRDRYGREFFSYIARFKKKNKGWPAGKPRKKVEVCLDQALSNAPATEAATV